MRLLQRLVREHEEALEADLAHHYPGVDYTDRWRRRPDGTPALSWRRLRVLIAHLPPESAWVAAVTGRAVPGAVESAVMQLQEAVSNQHRTAKDKAWEHPTLKALRAAPAAGTRTAKRSVMRERKREAALARRAAREAAQQNSDNPGETPA